MIAALASGFPVAFALPGAAIISIGLAAFTGYLALMEMSSAYFATRWANRMANSGYYKF